MKVKLIKRKNPQNPSEFKFYGAAVHEGKVDLDTIAEQISGRSTTTYGDILSVLQNFMEFLPFLLVMGKSVSLGSMGSLRISLRGDGVENPDDFDVSLIKKKRIIFSPGPKLKEKIRNIKLETLK